MGVRIIIRRFLEEQGYTILEAGHAAEALQICQQPEAGPLDLLLTDVSLPDISGPELARQVGQLYPDLKCLFISGYTEQQLASHEFQSKEDNLLPKPFSSEALIRKVQEILA